MYININTYIPYVPIDMISGILETILIWVYKVCIYIYMYIYIHLINMIMATIAVNNG